MESPDTPAPEEARAHELLRVIPGSEAVAKQAKPFTDRAGGMRSVLVNGSAGVIAGHLDQPIFILEFAGVDGKITEIGMIADPARLRGLDITDWDDG